MDNLFIPNLEMYHDMLKLYVNKKTINTILFKDFGKNNPNIKLFLFFF